MLQAPRNRTTAPQPQPLPADEERALRTKLGVVLPPSSVRHIDLTRQGFAGARTLLVHGDRGELFAKVFLHWPENKRAEDFRRELFGATFAGNVGLGPRVWVGDAEAGVMVTESLRNLFTAEGDGDRQPRLQLSFALLDRLRTLTVHPQPRHIDGLALYEKFLASLDTLPADRRADPRLALVQRVARAVSEGRLHGLSYPPSVVHGDFQHGNVLVDAPDRGHLIDWESYSFGDAAKDIASYLGRYAYAPEAMLVHATLTHAFDATDWHRAQLYVVFARAADFVAKSRGGRPWDVPERREAELAARYDRLKLDEAWLRDTAAGDGPAPRPAGLTLQG